MTALDRLSALIDRFDLSVQPAPPEAANLLIFPGQDGRLGWHLRFGQLGAGVPDHPPAFSARVDWGSEDNPLFTALPQTIERAIEPGDDLSPLVELLIQEYEASRCGSAAVLNRLGDVLILRIVREALERGATEPGVLGGLADPRISRVLVAVHEAPGRSWTVEDLAETAHLSRSRFVEVFQAAVGETPFAYIRRWRMTLARQDLQRGDRVQTVARRYGYASGEALNRSIKRQFGLSPTAMRSPQA